ncbi:hypothetical protein CKO39_10025 [Rhodopseudomonas palustris]|nr:hypothetical protein CKO39_10025 [Rhodopseudomonas palustris]
MVMVISLYLISGLLHQVACLHPTEVAASAVFSTHSVDDTTDASAVSVCDRCPSCSSAVLPASVVGRPSPDSRKACFAGSSLAIALQASPDTPPPKQAV